MKNIGKLMGFAAAAALAIGALPAVAAGDDIPIPPETDLSWEFMNLMCDLTGFDLYCDYIARNPKPETPDAPQPGG